MLSSNHLCLSTPCFFSRLFLFLFSHTGLLRPLLLVLVFYNAKAFNQDLSSWNVSQVQDMTQMFGLTLSFDQSLCGHWLQTSAPRSEWVSSAIIAPCNTCLYNDGTTINSVTCQCGDTVCTRGTGRVCVVDGNDVGQCSLCPTTLIHFEGKCQTKSAAVEALLADVADEVVQGAWDHSASSC